MPDPYTHNGFTLPDHLRQPLLDWVRLGMRPNIFIYAVLCNDFQLAALNADHESATNFPAIAKYVENELPPKCHGSEAWCNIWGNHRGKKGVAHRRYCTCNDPENCTLDRQARADVMGCICQVSAHSIIRRKP